MNMLLVLSAYFLLLLLVAHRTKGQGTNDAFFRARGKASWPMVAFGMVGASVSGVSLVSVPGWVATTGFTYLQMCFGFIVGYFVVAFVLLPFYYRMHLVSIYTFLEKRFDTTAHRTGALFFLLSKLTGASAKLYVVCLVLQTFVSDEFGVPFPITVICVLLLIWLYTRRSGIAAIVRTDVLQTACLLIAVFGMLFIAADMLGLKSIGDMWQAVVSHPKTKMWEWDWTSRQVFWRQFLSGTFIVVAMTGLDQDMMQKNLTCRSLREAQKNVCGYAFAFFPLNALLLSLGVLLLLLCQAGGITPPSGDSLLPSLVASGQLGQWIIIPFTIGIVAATFSSADSAMTALTTSFCIDILRIGEQGDPKRAERIRRMVHVSAAASILICVLLFRAADSTNVINAIYVLVSYTYGPLLGLFSFGLFTNRSLCSRFVPFICLLAPILCYVLDTVAPRLWGYTFGYELLLLNALLTILGLYCVSKKTAGQRTFAAETELEEQ